MRLEEDEYNQLKNVTLNITFPFKELSGFYTLKIYQETIKWLLKDEILNALLVFDGYSGEIYMEIVDSISQKYDESELSDLCYPALELQHNNKKVVPLDSIFARIKNPVKEFMYNDEIIEINQTYLNHAPCALKDLTIRITANLEYIDCDELDKKFDIVDMKDTDNGV